MSGPVRPRAEALEGSPEAPPRPFIRVPPWVSAALFLGVACRHLQFVHRHAVNMMFGDQWDFYQPMFLDQGWWATFDHQHGPHREGLGLVVTRVLAGLSGWNTRWDSFAASALMIGAAVLGMRLARRFGVPARSIVSVAVPLLFLNVHQYETFIGATNLSYGAMPMALFMAYCLCWFVRTPGVRLPALGALTFLLTFTGFGLFVGLLTPPLVAVELVQAWRSRDRARAAAAAAALALSAAGWAAFARGYTFQPATDGFRFPYEHPLQYLVFAARMLGNFFGTAVLSRGQLVLGIAATAALAAICAWHGVRCVLKGVAQEPRSVVLFCLSGFALLFCANCAIGRVFTGAIAPLAPRYATLLVPGGLALFLQLAALSSRPAFAWLALAYAVLLVPGTAFLRGDEAWGADWYSNGRTSWRATYLKTRNEAEADRVSQFAVYPGSVSDRLKYLEAHRLNLFQPLPGP